MTTTVPSREPTLLEDIAAAVTLLEGYGDIETTSAGIDVAARLRAAAVRIRREMEKARESAAYWDGQDVNVPAAQLAMSSLLERINGGPVSP